MRHLCIIFPALAFNALATGAVQADDTVGLTLTGQIASECRLESPTAAEQTSGDPRLGLRANGELTARFKIACNSPVVGEFRLENGALSHIDPEFLSATGGLAHVPVYVTAETGLAAGDGQFDGEQLTAPRFFSSGDEPVFDQEMIFRIAWDGSDRYYAGRYRDVLHVTLQAVP